MLQDGFWTLLASLPGLSLLIQPIKKHCNSSRIWSSSDAFPFDECPDAFFDPVADDADLFNALSFGIGQGPIFPLHTGNDRALFTAPHRDQHFSAGRKLDRQPFRL